MFREALSNPAIFALVCAEDDNQIVTSSVVGVQEIRDYAQEADTASKDDELVFFAEFFEDVLLEVLGRSVSRGGLKKDAERTRGSESFTGRLPSAFAIFAPAVTSSARRRQRHTRART
jgi:hypothetical protein